MKTTMMRWLLAALPLAIAAPPPVQAQDAPATAAQAAYSKEQLDQLLAPIALYPDGVLAQVLMAATYPLEVVEAARWVKENPDMKGDAAVKACEDKGWDVSVQSLVAFPQTVTMMSDKLQWTQDLGNAVLAQQKDVLDSVQRLRAMAQQAGSLQSNEQQTVTVEPAAAGATTQTIVIEPAQPQTIYVPAYNPTTVYGTWPYPAYTPFYYPPNPLWYPGGALARGFAWGVGFAAAGAIFGGCNWRGGDINVNVNRATNINRNFNANSVRANSWQHNSTHRKGVAYKDTASRQKYGANTAGADRRQEYRGREAQRDAGARAGDRTGERGQAGDRTADRGQVGDRTAERGQAGDRAADRGQAGDRGGERAQAGDRGSAQTRDAGTRDAASRDVGSRDAGSRDRGASAGTQPAGFEGMGSRGSDVRAQSDRGQASRQASQANFGGGGARASGGGGGARASGGGGGGGARMGGGGGGGRGGGGRGR